MRNIKIMKQFRLFLQANNLYYDGNKFYMFEYVKKIIWFKKITVVEKKIFWISEIELKYNVKLKILKGSEK